MKHCLRIFFLIAVFVISIRPLYSSEARCYGLYLGDDISREKIEDSGRLLGRMPCVIHIFWDWQTSFDKNVLDEIWSAGAIPLITLEPWIAVSKKGVSLKDIADGKQDGVIGKFSEVLKSFGNPVMIRFAHEMNGNWYPWSGENNGRSGINYVTAYRYLHDLVNSNVQPLRPLWVWAVNAEDVPKRKWNRPISYYPGDGYVDMIGIDGYSWPKFWPWSRGKWVGNIYDWIANRVWGMLFTADRIFAGQIKYLKKNVPNKAIIISEVAAGLKNGQKVDWIVDYFEKMGKKYTEIPLFVWFDVEKELDWRIESDPDVLEEFRKGVINNWNGQRRTLLQSFGRGE